MPRELITVSVGQAGNQIAHRFWELAVKEHAAFNTDGLFTDSMSRSGPGLHWTATCCAVLHLVSNIDPLRRLPSAARAPCSCRHAPSRAHTKPDLPPIHARSLLAAYFATWMAGRTCPWRPPPRAASGGRCPLSTCEPGQCSLTWQAPRLRSCLLGCRLSAACCCPHAGLPRQLHEPQAALPRRSVHCHTYARAGGGGGEWHAAGPAGGAV